jgi:hypothetical protein
MKMRRGLWLLLAVVALVLGNYLGAAPASDAGSPGDPPEYYVDGARPAPDADAATLEGCVPWSAERTDVHICGLIEANWQPPAATRYDASLCQSAQDILAEQTILLQDMYGFVPTVDPSSCLATGRSGGGFDWFVVFTVMNGKQAEPYQNAIVAIDVDEGLDPWVSLS